MSKFSWKKFLSVSRKECSLMKILAYYLLGNEGFLYLLIKIIISGKEPFLSDAN